MLCCTSMGTTVSHIFKRMAKIAAEPAEAELAWLLVSIMDQTPKRLYPSILCKLTNDEPIYALTNK